MPDHIHALISFGTNEKMSNTIKSWKRYTSQKGNIDWQRNFFDHRMRSDDSFEEKAFYIQNNPIRKGLVSKIEEWPYFWIPNETGDSENRSYHLKNTESLIKSG
jgi:putative transposase